MKYLKHLLWLACAIGAQAGLAQTHAKKATQATAALPKESYGAHEVLKTGAGDVGLYYDTVAIRLKPTDPVTANGRQYQDVKLTLGAGDVIKVNLVSNNSTPPFLSLLTAVNGRLSKLKALIDTTSAYDSKLFYKSAAAGVYTLRLTCRQRAPKNKSEQGYYYGNDVSFSLNFLIAAPESAQVPDNPAVCEQVSFLLRQQLTNYMQITGAITDTTMDVLNKKKIGFINHSSAFRFYKNSPAAIEISPEQTYVVFDQMLQYKDDADAAQAQRYFIESFGKCLGSEWKGEPDPGDPNWYRFKRSHGNNINIILYPGYKNLQILM